MSKHRPLNYGSPVPQSFLDAMQEFIGAMASPNLVLSMAPGSGNQIQIVAGAGSAQVGLGIDGLWRYISAPTQTTVTGAAGTYDVFVTTGSNSFAVNPSPPPPETDSTNYAFALSTPLLQGNVPGAAHYRKVGEVIFDGTRVLNLRQTLGADGAQLAQPGDMKMSAAASPPAGWLLCDGSAISRSTYAALYAALGGTGSPWGQGDGSTTFNLPDLRGRAPIGAGTGTASGATSHTRGGYGGEEGHLLTALESGTNGNGGTGGDDRDHTHSGTTGTESADHVHGIGGWGEFATVDGSLTLGSWASGTGHTPALVANHASPIGSTGGRSAAHTHSFGTSGRSTGHLHALGARNADSTHNNMQPFVACSYFIKT